ncbi:MAG: hypothetical protein AAGK21_05135 [Bacteroidota bacterium]
MSTFDDLHLVWQQADAPPPTISLGDLKDEAAQLDRTLRRRDIGEVGAAVLVAVFFGFVAITSPSVRVAALTLVGLSVATVGVLLLVRLWIPRASPWAPLREALSSEHRWLSVQTRLLRWAGLWYVAPNILGILAFDHATDGIRPFYAALVLVFAAFLVWVNWRAADDLAATRDAFAAHLDTLSSDSDA